MIKEGYKGTYRIDEDKEIINLNANVYYEAGFAHGLKIPVIYLCSEDKVKYLPFDTKTINHLTWNYKNIEKLKEDLKDWIDANIK